MRSFSLAVHLIICGFVMIEIFIDDVWRFFIFQHTNHFKLKRRGNDAFLRRGLATAPACEKLEIFMKVFRLRFFFCGMSLQEDGKVLIYPVGNISFLRNAFFYQTACFKS